MYPAKTIFYAIIAALIGMLAIVGLLSVDDSESIDTPATAANTITTVINAAPSGLFTDTDSDADNSEPEAIAFTESDWPRTITDSRANTTTLQHRPRRIISLAPNVTQILRAIGADEALVAIPREGSDPSEAAELVRLQVYPAPSTEAILALQPDLLVGADITSPAIAARLRSFGLPLIILSGNDYQGIVEDIIRTGEATGYEATATILAQALTAQLEAVRTEVAATRQAPMHQTAMVENQGDQIATSTPKVQSAIDDSSTQAATDDSKAQAAQAQTTTDDSSTQATTTAQSTQAAAMDRPKVLLFVGETPDYAAGKGSYAANLLDLAGGDNIALQLNQPWPQLSREFILEANPQVLIFTINAAAITSAPDRAGRSEQLLAYLRSDPLWRQLQAVRNDQVYAIDQSLLNVPGPHVGEALARMRTIIQEVEKAMHAD